MSDMTGLKGMVAHKMFGKKKGKKKLKMSNKPEFDSGDKD